MNYERIGFYEEHDDLVECAREMFSAWRKRIDLMTDAEWREYRRRQAERYASA